MKTYMFKHGRVESENLNANAIKDKEKVFGELVGVMTNRGFVEVVTDVIKISYKGEEHTFKEWAEITGINEMTLRSRYRKGERDYILFRRVGT